MKISRHSSSENHHPKSPAKYAGIVSLTVASLMAQFSAPALAQSFVVQNGQTVGAQTLPNDGDTGVVDTGGAIRTNGVGEVGVDMQAANQTLTNSGEIHTTGNNSAFGVNSTGANARITNIGSIRIDGNFSGGIHASGANVVIDNQGEIRTFGHDTYGIKTEATAEGARITNSGTISTTIENAYAIQVGGASTSVTNSGIINTAAQSAHGVQAFGASTTIRNTGSINTVGAQAHGIQLLAGATSSSVFNGGTVKTTGKRAHGIEAISAGSVITNTGSIVTEAEEAIGISALGTNGQTFNSGRIKSTDFAVVIEGANSILTLQPGSVIEGKIQFDNGTPTQTLAVENGLSINKTLTGVVPGTINPNGAPMAISGTQVAVVDPTNLSTQDEQLADLTGGISSALQNRLSGVRNNSTGTVATSGPFDTALSPVDPGHPFWIEGFGSYRQQEASSPAVETQQWVGGFVIGADDLLRDNLRAGFFGGAAWGGVEADFNSQDTDSQSFFVGSYASLLKAGLIFDLALTVGYSDFDQERSVANNLVAGGLETATADFSGWFVSPELTVTKPTVILGRRLEGSLALRYAGLFLDSYTESGTTAPLTVDNRDVHIGVARLQLAAPFESLNADGSAFRYKVKAGVEARTNFGGDTIDGALLGQNISFNPGGDDNTLGGYVGLSGEYDTGGGLVLSASTEGLIDTTGSYQFSGRAGVKFRF
ncbi:MAG: autotransporter outer membrane beta-barrel domain-containing protein [Stappiaceae bacterium]